MWFLEYSKYDLWNKRFIFKLFSSFNNFEENILLNEKLRYYMHEVRKIFIFKYMQIAIDTKFDRTIL